MRNRERFSSASLEKREVFSKTEKKLLESLNIPPETLSDLLDLLNLYIFSFEDGKNEILKFLQKKVKEGKMKEKLFNKLKSQLETASKRVEKMIKKDFLEKSEEERENQIKTLQKEKEWLSEALKIWLEIGTPNISREKFEEKVEEKKKEIIEGKIKKKNEQLEEIKNRLNSLFGSMTPEERTMIIDSSFFQLVKEKRKIKEEIAKSYEKVVILDRVLYGARDYFFENLPPEEIEKDLIKELRRVNFHLNFIEKLKQERR